MPVVLQTHAPRRRDKCIETHLTVDCTRSRKLPAKCALCSGAHTENYKDCLAFKKLIKFQDMKRHISRTTNNVASKKVDSGAPTVKVPVTRPKTSHNMLKQQKN